MPEQVPGYLSSRFERRRSSGLWRFDRLVSRNHIWHTAFIIVRHCHSEYHENSDLVKPRPSILTTIQVLGSRPSGCSKLFTYSYLHSCQLVDAARKLQNYLEFAIIVALHFMNWTVLLSLHNIYINFRYQCGASHLKQGAIYITWYRWVKPTFDSCVQIF